MAASIDSTGDNAVLNGGYGGGSWVTPQGLPTGVSAAGVSMRWGHLEAQSMERRLAAATYPFAKDMSSVEFSPLSTTAERISEVLTERYPW